MDRSTEQASLGRKVGTAEWRHLVYLAFPAPPEALRDCLPDGVELDLWEDKAWLSLVVFLVQNVSCWGMKLPGLGNFPGLSLRIPVKRADPKGQKKGIVVLKELTPKPLMARIGKFFHRSWEVVPMDFAIEFEPAAESGRSRPAASGLVSASRISRAVVRYSWQGNAAGSLALKSVGLPTPASVGPDENFFMERIWGYSRDGRGRTREYHLGYPTWYSWDVEDVQLDWNPGALVGERFRSLLAGPPASAYLAKGSPVVLFGPRPL